jgi:hypothetical protein
LLYIDKADGERDGKRTEAERWETVYIILLYRENEPLGNCYDLSYIKNGMIGNSTLYGRVG